MLIVHVQFLSFELLATRSLKRGCPVCKHAVSKIKLSTSVIEHFALASACFLCTTETSFIMSTSMNMKSTGVDSQAHEAPYLQPRVFYLGPNIDTTSHYHENLTPSFSHHVLCVSLFSLRQSFLSGLML